MGTPVVLLFSGSYKYSLDDKNRLIIPVKFREILAAESVEKLYIAKGDSHLFAFPLPVFVELSKQLKSLSFTNESKQNYVRMIFSNAYDVTPDKQGRIILPKEQCEKVGISSEAIVIGVLDRMEIWSPEKWADFYDKATLRGLSANLEL
ncbi:MAG: division/cell wall cluster transcriptional repressor MraZ [Candidatus Lindowbacteria bacterium]|nr:division/cell wall cluster transcriptional repressor MraZ [Candidatus Lindowbacteria bacterium]